MTCARPATSPWPATLLLVGAGLVCAAQVGKAPAALQAVQAALAMPLAQAAWLLSAFGVVGVWAGPYSPGTACDAIARTMNLTINGQSKELPDDAVAPDMPLLWALRDVLHLTGTKFGCGIAACGACTVMLDGQAVRSCVTPLSAAQGHAVHTIESLGTPEQPHALQKAWVQHQVPQCG